MATYVDTHATKRYTAFNRSPLIDPFPFSNQWIKSYPFEIIVLFLLCVAYSGNGSAVIVSKYENGFRGARGCRPKDRKETGKHDISLSRSY